MAWAGAPYLGVAVGPESQKGEEACVTGWHCPFVPPSGRDGTRGPHSEEIASPMQQSGFQAGVGFANLLGG